MLVCTYILFLFLGSCADAPVTFPFLSNNYWPVIGKPDGSCIPWIIIPLQQTPLESVRSLNFLDHWHQTAKHRPIKLLELAWWLLLFGLSKITLLTSSGVDNFTDNIFCRHAYEPTSLSYRKVRLVSSYLH